MTGWAPVERGCERSRWSDVDVFVRARGEAG